MIPQGGVLGESEIEFEQWPSKTYRLDPNSKRIVGFVDGLDAVKQATFKILQTIRFEYLIYSPNYGLDGGSVGKSRSYFQSEIKRKVREALLQDNRISDVIDFSFSYDGDSATVEFEVISKFGDFEYSKEVNQ